MKLKYIYSFSRLVKACGSYYLFIPSLCSLYWDLLMGGGYSLFPRIGGVVILLCSWVW